MLRPAYSKAKENERENIDSVNVAWPNRQYRASDRPSGWNRVQVTGFTNGEEDEMKFSQVVPFLVEDQLLRLGAIFEKNADWQTFTITDGHLLA